jgi:hypothetical protein
MERLGMERLADPREAPAAVGIAEAASGGVGKPENGNRRADGES